MNYVPDTEHPLAIACPWFPPAEQLWLQEEFRQILSGKLSMGQRVTQFEREFSSYCGVVNGIAFPSCTSALEASLIAVGVRPGDEVLVPAETFVATGMAVHLVGAIPIFTEISQASFGMDFEDAWQCVTDRTKGAIVVHFGGIIPPGLIQFVERMRATGRFVIEDAAHAAGAELDGRRAGNFGDIACFSFYPTKIITTGEGGMAVTSEPRFAEILRSLQNRGLDLVAPNELYARPGRNNRFSEIAAAMGLSQLRCLPEFLAARREVARTYDTLLARHSEILTPVVAEQGSLPSYWRYVVLLRHEIGRPELKKLMAAEAISIDWAYDPPMHLQPVFTRMYNTSVGMLPRTEKLLSTHICLPVHARMRVLDAEYVVERVVESVRTFLN